MTVSRPLRLLAAASSAALAVGLLGGVTPVAQAAENTPPPTAPSASPERLTDGAEGVRRGEQIRDLKGGVCAVAVPEGMVRLAGPGGTRLVARVRRSGDARLLTIVSGSGRIGGVVVRPKDVSGELTWRAGKNGAGSMTGSVTIALADHAKVSRTWVQRVEVSAQPSGCDWSGTVQLTAKGVGASLDLRGPVEKNGSYSLRGSGSVSIDRTKIPVTGVLRASNQTKPTWRITGQSKREVRLGGAQLTGIKVALTDAISVPVGTAVLQLDVPRLSANARLEIAGSDTWRAAVTSSNRRTWVLPQADMVVQTGKLTGSIGKRAGQQQWLLTAPGAVKIGSLDYVTEVGLTGPLTYTVQAKGAVGQILGLPQSRPFTGVPTKLTITPKGITGALSVATRGNLLLDLEGQWRTATDYILKPVAGQGWTFDPYISHSIRAGKGAIRLSGPVAPDYSVQLIGSGTLDVSGTRVPVRGYYKRSSFSSGAVPYWALAAYPSEAPGGRIPLQGGAGFVGGVIVFNGTGAQPASTIPATLPVTAPTANDAKKKSGGKAKKQSATTPPKQLAAARVTASTPAPSAATSAAAPASAPIVSGGQTLTTIAYDGFAYPNGDLPGYKGGSGWTGAWVNTYTSGGNAQVQATGMTYPGLYVTGGSVVWGSGGNQVNGSGRTLPTMSTGVVYLQFLSNFGSQTGGGTPQIRLVNTATTGWQGGFGNNGSPNMAILDSTLNPVATTSTSMNANLLTVVRIDYGAKTTSMWVNPDLSSFDYANPPTPSAQTTNFAPVFNQIQPFTRSGQVFDELTVMVLNPAPAPVTVTGNTTVQLSDSDDDTFYLPVTYSYTDPNNWTATVNATTPSNIYNPYTGLEIPETDFSGTVTDAGGRQTWNVSIAMETWQDMAIGVDYKGAFTISNTCPLSDQDNCPDSDGIYIGGQSTLSFDDTSFPTAYADGAFLTDLSWGWWDATATGSVSINGITMANPELTIWHGSGTGPNPEIVMPDLSDLNGNGMNLEFCANFTVPVPDITTINTLGCAEWTDEGAILAQVNTGGNVNTDDYNGVSVNSTTLTGYVWNGLPDTETVFLDGVEIDAEPQRNYVTADIVVPGNAMHDFGTGTSSDATISATGWFDMAGDFDIEGTIPVNLSGGGFTLEEILISISKEKEDEQTDFNLRFDAECDVVVNGNHFPLDVYIGYEKEGDSTITVGMSATGTQSTQPEGTMDFVNLVPTGDFEPENASIVDGSFDGKLPNNIATDGGFERSTSPGELIVNGSFDDSMGLNILPNPGFEDGTSGNMLPNGDFEDSNFLVNGDFEMNGGSLVGWLSNSSALSFSITDGTASSDTGPEDQGSYVAILNNNSASNNSQYGLTQTIPVPLNHFGIEVSAWVMSNKSTSAPFHILVTSNGCSSADSFKSPTVTAVSGSWTEAVASGSLGNGCQSVTVTLIPENSGTSVQIDAVELSITSTYGGNTVPTVARPNIVGTFDSLATSPLMSGYSSGVYEATDYPGTLRSDGKQSWMTYSTTTGYTPGDFDVTYKLMFPTGSSDRDIANFGFWLDGNYSSMKGYAFRLQTANGDGGFFSVSKSSKSMVSGASKAPNVTRGHWYQVRLTAVSGYVTAYVVDLTNGGALFFTQTLKINTSPPGGVFGQVPDGASSSTGIRWDDLAINSLSNMPGQQTIVKGPNQVWFANGSHTGNGRASLYTTSQANMPFEFSTDDSVGYPSANTYYTYSTWLRAASGSISGSISLSAIGGSSTESASVPFTVGGGWTQVSVTLAVNNSDHTDLRPRITVGTTNAELQVDDQVLQQLPWRSSPANTGVTSQAVTTAYAHTGTNSLAVTTNGSSGAAYYPWTVPGAQEEVVTASAWVLAPAGVSGDLRIQEQSGQTSEPFTATGTWQQVTVSRTVNSAGTNTQGLYLAVDINSGQSGKTLYIDDVVVTTTDVFSEEVNALGAPDLESGWTMTEQACTAGCSSYQDAGAILLSDAAEARSGEGSMLIGELMDGAAVWTTGAKYVTSQTPAVGSTWEASVWLKGQPYEGTAMPSATVTLSAGGDSVSKTVTTTGSYANVTLDLQIAKGGGPLTFTVATAKGSNTAVIAVDDVSVTESGLTTVDPWTPYAPSGFLGIEGVSDPANAYSGDGYLQLTNAGTGGGAAYLDGAYKPVSGMTHEMSFWIKSPQGNVGGVAAWLRTQDSGGTILDSYQMSVPVTGTWTQVFLSLPIKSTNAVDLRTEFDLPKGAIVWIDNVESRDVNYWAAAQPSNGIASITIIDGVSDAVDGMNYLRFSTSASGGGVSDVITADVNGDPIDVIGGSSYKMQAYVRSTTGASVNGTMSLATGNGSTAADGASVNFTAGSDWTPVDLMLDTTKNANTMIPKITLGGAGQLDVDALTVVPVLIEQTDPWSASGSGVTWGVYDDPANAYDSSYGVMEFSVANAGTGVQHSASQTSNVGDQLSATAFVRTAGTNVSGTLQVTSIGGSAEEWQTDFTANGDWQMVSVPVTVAQSGHTGFTVQVLLDTPGVTTYLDQVALQTNPWTPNSGVTQSIVFDGASAQSGSGFLRLTPTGSSPGSAYNDMAASSDIDGVYAAGTTWTVTAYVRSSVDGQLATGKVSLGASTGTPKTGAISVGSEWTAVTASYPVGSSDLTSLRVTLTVNGSSVPLDVDSVTISDGTPPPDGITTPLPHPNAGWVYLWDEAFGIPGMHLWAISAQVDFVDDFPGLGVSATTYQDPSKMTHVLSGTNWLKGDMAMNFSESDPCFLFDFASDGGGSGVSLGTGVFTANDFSISFAPRGCQVGPYTLPKGAALAFDGELGDGTVSFDIAITEGDDGPEFTEDIGIADITIGGFDFKEMDLNILITPTDDSITFVGNMATPMGMFNGSYDLDANPDGLVMDGSVQLTDWGWAGGGFDVEEFDYDMSMTVPLGAGECGSFSEDASGLMDMGSKTSLSFTGQIAMNCGKLEVLEMSYDYHHSSITETFEIDYDSSTGILAGGVEFDFERSSSWKHIFHRYNRHPKFNIWLDFSMNVEKPSTAYLDFGGKVTVSGGDGSLDCTLVAGTGSDWADDQCHLHVHLNIGGGHTYDASW